MVCTDRQGLFVTESLKRYSGAPTCESGLTLFRSAAQADLFYFDSLQRAEARQAIGTEALPGQS